MRVQPILASSIFVFVCLVFFRIHSKFNDDDRVTNSLNSVQGSFFPSVHRPEIEDFYQYYTRSPAALAWGSPIPENSSVPPSGLGAFMILWTKDTETGRAQLKRCLQSIDIFFNDQFDYPIIVFYQNLSAQSINLVKSWTRSRIEFFGNTLIDHEYLKVFERSGFQMFSWYPEYLHMIRMNIHRWPLHRALFGYRFIFKFDSDAAFVEPIHFDFFKMLRDRDMRGAYLTQTVDPAFVCKNLYETVDEILQYNRIKSAQDIYRMPKYTTWYGFGFVLDTAFARSPAYLNTFWHIDTMHGMFRFRWGDPQLYLITSLFLVDSQTMKLQIGFSHQDNCDNVKFKTSCNADISGVWENIPRPIRTLSSSNANWIWNPVLPFNWSTFLWPTHPLSRPPYCFSHHGCK